MFRRKISTNLLPVLLILLVFLSCSSAYRYIKFPEKLPAAKTENFSESETDIEKTLQKSSQNPLCAKYFGQFFHTAYIIIEGFDSLCFTYHIQDSVAFLKRGFDTSVTPELTIYLTKSNCENLFRIFEDSIVTDEEEYRIFRVTLLPSIKSSFKMDAIYNPQIAKKLALPPFIQLTLKNEKKYVYNNTTGEYTISIVNVKGQWLVFEGSAGQPEIKMAFTHAQAKEFRKLVFRFITGKNAPREKKFENLKAIKTFLDNTTVRE